MQCSSPKLAARHRTAIYILTDYNASGKKATPEAMSPIRQHTANSWAKIAAVC